MSTFFPDGPSQPAAPDNQNPELAAYQTSEGLELLQRELALSGHQHTIQHSAPVVLQRFFTGEIDLDTELSRRFNGAPLMSYISLRPRKPGTTPRGTAEIMSQDNNAALMADINRFTGVLELSFTLGAMLSLRFTLSNLPEIDRRRWLDLMRREQGIAFLWSRARWERDYMIFIVRKYNIRAYAFSPHGFEAAVRMTPEVLAAYLDWLEAYWF
ncbi:MAG: hypothetical protein JXN59_14790 [Anaerolineae bacterium]|nr:hypothetical protein [Anaerolineae bacterium]